MKTWKAGVADEEWKREICRRDIRQVDDLVVSLGAILFEDQTDILSQLSEVSGADIVRRLKMYRASITTSLENGISKNGQG